MEVRISDHALIRYIERGCGRSLEGYRDDLRKLIEENWDNTKATTQSFAIVLDDLGASPVVTTILGPEMRPKRKVFARRVLYIENFKSGEHP
jgi:hypothetical protein